LTPETQLHRLNFLKDADVKKGSSGPAFCCRVSGMKEAQKVIQDNGVNHVLVVDKDLFQGILGEDKLKEIQSRPVVAGSAWEREYQFRCKKVEEVME